MTDTGIGIPMERLQDIFAQFTQVDGSGTRQFGGTGLGLAVAQRLIERMGGGIAAESTPGEGSVFRFHIMVGSVSTAGEVPTSEANSKPLQVLVAEDNPVNRLVVTRILERLGNRVDSVVNGKEAVEAVSNGSYDLVLMDLMMPEMGGLQATNAIRALPSPVSRIPIVALTANVLTADEASCREAGMDGYLSKPITSDRLQQAMDHAMLAHMAR